MTPRRARSFVAASAVSVALVAGCTGPPPSPVASPAPSGAVTVAPAPAGEPVPTAAPAAPVTAEEVERNLLSGVRVAEQDGFDRIVFEFTDGVYDHLIEYTDLPVTADPSDEVVPLDGAAAIQVSMIGASAYRDYSDDAPAFPVERRIPAGLPQVTELASLSDWEGVLLWAAGVRSRTTFTVTELVDPPRLVIDVAHAP